MKQYNNNTELYHIKILNIVLYTFFANNLDSIIIDN